MKEQNIKQIRVLFVCLFFLRLFLINFILFLGLGGHSEGLFNAKIQSILGQKMTTENVPIWAATDEFT